MASTNESGGSFKDRMKMFQDKERTEGSQGIFPSAGPKKKSEPIGQAALFDKPHQLIRTETEEDQLHVVEETLALLRCVDRQVNSVAITGQYRTGKSFLLNQLAGRKGFAIGRTTNACTKGIWVWCQDHPVQTDQVLLLLDVEGFGDGLKANKREDFLLFTLATLLSSTIVYNNKGAFGAEAIDRLRFLESIESSVGVVDQENVVELLDFYFPKFVLTLRDFGLEMVTGDGKKTNPDGYFETMLILKRPKEKKTKEVAEEPTKEVAEYNHIRLLIRKYFTSRKCFSFKTPCPSPDEKDEIDEKELHPEFVKSLKSFRTFVYGCQPMMMKSGRPINGRMFASLAQSYVDHIGLGKPPCIRDAFVFMTSTENDFVIEEASKIYTKEMQKRLAAINPNDSGLSNHHQQCMGRALKYLKGAVVFDEEQICRKQMTVRFKELFHKFKRVCDKNSEVRCWEVLGRLNLKIVQKLKDRVYAKPDGYDEYYEDIKHLMKRYDGTCGLGTMSAKALQSFLDGKEAESDAVYQMVFDATGKHQERRGNIWTIGRESYHEQLVKDEEILERQLSQEIKEEQSQTYDMIKTKYIGKLSLQLQELDQQIQEEVEDGDRRKSLLEEKTFVTKLVGTLKGLSDISDEASYSRLPPQGEESPPGTKDSVMLVTRKYLEKGQKGGKQKKFCFIQ